MSFSETMKSAPVLYMVICLPRHGFIFATNILGNLSVRICSRTCRLKDVNSEPLCRGKGAATRRLH